jgi:DNA repair protein RecN (Recombination protein N)
MLIRLHIQNLAIAENICISLAQGLNIITGETGAGKSLLVDGLALLRGGKPDLGLIRDGHESAVITGSFKVSNTSAVWRQFEAHGCLRDDEHPDEITIRRVLNRSGKHRCYVNDTQVSTKVIQELASELIDISSQFENQKLLNTETHTLYLDEFVGATELRLKFQKAWQAAWSNAQEIETLEKEINLRRREQDLCQFELEQIEQADLKEDEWTRVQRMVTLGQKTAQAAKMTSDLKSLLFEEDHSCLTLLNHCRKTIERLQKVAGTEKIPLSVGKVDEVSAHLEELLQQVDQTESLFQIDEHELQEALTRSEIYNALLQKFGPTLADISAHREHCLSTVSKTDALNEQLSLLKANLAASINSTLELAEALSKQRNSGLTQLSAAIQKALSELGMPRARFVCELVPHSSGMLNKVSSTDVFEGVDTASLETFLLLGRTGLERAQFLMSANAGLSPQPIEKIASGGELSRTMLAIKSILFEDGTMSVFVFDEIDTGISGSIASKVGRKLSDFCAKRQALCITHLAQVACFARCHFIASKHLKKGKTLAEIKVATRQEQIQALAGMVAGEKLTQESLAQAQALLSEAQGDVHP